MIADEHAEAIGWRRGNERDREVYGVGEWPAGCTLWVRIDGLPHGWAVLPPMSMNRMVEALESCNEILAEQQLTHPYAFDPAEPSRPSTTP